MVEQDASDLFYRAGGTPRLRIDGKITSVSDKPLSIEEVIEAAHELMNAPQRAFFQNNLDIDFALYLQELNRRFRVSIFTQRNSPSIVVRNVRSAVANFEELNLPAEILQKLSSETRGLVLLTGSMGSGKSTTIASMIEYINQNTKNIF